MNPVLKRIVDIFMTALVVYKESRGEPRDAQLGVAFTVQDRANEGGWWGNDDLAVATKKWQFSSITDPNDRQFKNWPSDADPSWQECLQLAADVVDGKVLNPVPGTDSYYDISIPAPEWAKTGTFIQQIGKIRFYKTR